MTSHEIEFGLDTPAYVTVDASGQRISGDVVIRNTIEEAVLADAVGIDSFNIGEHYRPELMDSAGHVMLAAIAGRTVVRPDDEAAGTQWPYWAAETLEAASRWVVLAG